MRHDPKYEAITVKQFLSIDFRTDRKYELIDGAIKMMTGGTRAHAGVATNILLSLGLRLRGSGCRPYNSDAGIYVDETTMRYPDVSVMCEERASPETDNLISFEHPRIVFEVLSPSTQAEDQGSKLVQYCQIASLDTIIFVDPAAELSRVVQRFGPSSWNDDMFAQPHDIELPSLGIVLPHAEIFARD